MKSVCRIAPIKFPFWKVKCVKFGLSKRAPINFHELTFDLLIKRNNIVFTQIALKIEFRVVLISLISEKPCITVSNDKRVGIDAIFSHDPRNIVNQFCVLRKIAREVSFNLTQQFT